jgi:hypothetical protein
MRAGFTAAAVMRPPENSLQLQVRMAKLKLHTRM